MQPPQRKRIHMKIRCTHNSIRLRVRKSEVGRLQNGQVITEAIRFLDGNQLEFCLKRDALLETIQVAFGEGRLVVTLPQRLVDDWARTDRVGLEDVQLLPEDEQLHILIEKDFPCSRDEDRTDFFGELAAKDDKAC